jgi:hypothetical protein
MRDPCRNLSKLTHKSGPTPFLLSHHQVRRPSILASFHLGRPDDPEEHSGARELYHSSAFVRTFPHHSRPRCRCGLRPHSIWLTVALSLPFLVIGNESRALFGARPTIHTSDSSSPRLSMASGEASPLRFVCPFSLPPPLYPAAYHSIILTFSLFLLLLLIFPSDSGPRAQTTPNLNPPSSPPLPLPSPPFLHTSLPSFHASCQHGESQTKPSPGSFPSHSERKFQPISTLSPMRTRRAGSCLSVRLLGPRRCMRERFSSPFSFHKDR